MISIHDHDNAQVYGAHVNMQPLETRKILLQVSAI